MVAIELFYAPTPGTVTNNYIHPNTPWNSGNNPCMHSGTVVILLRVIILPS